MVTNANAKPTRRPIGMELVEITPILLGGDPIEAKNKMWLTRQQHFEFVRHWNKVISDIRHDKFAEIKPR